MAVHPPAETTTEPLPPRAVMGTVWRAVATLVVVLGLCGGAAWVDTTMHRDGLPVALPSQIAALLTLAVVATWLRVGTTLWAVVPALAAAFGGIMAAALLDAGALDGGRLHRDVLTGSPWSQAQSGIVAAGLLVVVLGVALAAVRGHRHPRSFRTAQATS
ncbi:hypothetical protein [Streptomyces sp. NPDC059850]|uniref:hypothetical protein n=1 Tax=Streptomyces sp. NPDC059850 TaxID=3346970 RepID=UPI00365CF072